MNQDRFLLKNEFAILLLSLFTLLLSFIMLLVSTGISFKAIYVTEEASRLVWLNAPERKGANIEIISQAKTTSIIHDEANLIDFWSRW